MTGGYHGIMPMTSRAQDYSQGTVTSFGDGTGHIAMGKTQSYDNRIKKDMKFKRDMYMQNALPRLS